MKNNETTKEMIIRKLTSRKLWVALISFVSAIMMYFNCAESEVAQVSTIIMAFGSGTTKKSVSEVAKEVLAGAWGNGEDRKKKLIAAGYDYSAVQAEVNRLCNKKSVDTIAREVIAGKWGNGDTRKKKLQAAGYNYSEVQKRVNQLL